MKTMKKFMVTCAAATAIAAVASVSVMAADYSAADNSVKYTVPTADAGTQMTLLVVPKGAKVTDENIYYIDQDVALSGSALLKGDSLADGVYEVKVGYYKDGSFAIAPDEFTVGKTKPDYTLGDVNNDGMILSDDALMCLEAEMGNIELTEAQTLAADVNKDSIILSDDALLILEYELGNIEEF